MAHTPQLLDHAPGVEMEHSVRTRLAILTLISGNLDLLYERLNDDKRREMIRDIRTHTQLLSELVCDAMEASGRLG